MDVVNGIAHDARAGRLFVTGKDFPQLWEVSVVEDSAADLDATRAACFIVSA